jgi:hypothetical protein
MLEEPIGSLGRHLAIPEKSCMDVAEIDSRTWDLAVGRGGWVVDYFA